MVSGNVELMSRASYTPRVCLYDVMNRLGEVHVDRIVVMLQTEGGNVETYMSHMPISGLTYLGKCLDRIIYNFIERAAGGK